MSQNPQRSTKSPPRCVFGRRKSVLLNGDPREHTSDESSRSNSKEKRRKNSQKRLSRNSSFSSFSSTPVKQHRSLKVSTTGEDSKDVSKHRSPSQSSVKQYGRARSEKNVRESPTSSSSAEEREYKPKHKRSRHRSSSSSAEERRHKKKKSKKKKNKNHSKEKKERKEKKMKKKEERHDRRRRREDRLKRLYPDDRMSRSEHSVPASWVDSVGSMPPMPVIPKTSETSDKSMEVVRKTLKPMTYEEYMKQQSVMRHVYDEETGRTRLIRGEGEVMEEIVSKARHQSINKAATKADGISFQAGLQRK